MSPSPFFLTESARSAIRTLAGAENLTLFVGAGVSGAQGAPSWHALVELLLIDLATEAFGLPKKAAPTFAHDYLEKVGVTPAVSSLVEQWGEAELIRKANVKLDARKKRSGNLAQNVLFLADAWRRNGKGDSVILTTNYDSVLEDAADAFRRNISPNVGGEGGTFKSYVSNRLPADRKIIPIVHIHGKVTNTGATGQFVLSERQYSNIANNSDWRRELVSNRLRSSAALFVGMSLLDPNIVRYLVDSEARNGMPAFIIFSRQDHPWVQGDGIDKGLERVFEKRLHHLGLSLLRTDYYAQISQFLNELALARIFGPEVYFAQDSDISYDRRLESWKQAIEKTPYARGRAGESFGTSTSNVYEVLSTARNVISQAFVVNRSRGSERLKLELWGRDPYSKRRLCIWGSADSKWQDPRTNRGDLIVSEASDPAIRVFCNGTPARGSMTDKRSIWRFVMAVPVILGDEHYSLPVGTIVLSSNSDSSFLKDLESRPESDLLTYLNEVGLHILDPSADGRNVPEFRELPPNVDVDRLHAQPVVRYL